MRGSIHTSNLASTSRPSLVPSSRKPALTAPAHSHFLFCSFYSCSTLPAYTGMLDEAGGQAEDGHGAAV